MSLGSATVLLGEPVVAREKGVGKDSAQVRFIDSNASVLLDLIRGLAAVLVVAVHLRNMLFMDYVEAVAAGSSKAVAPLYFLSSGGHQAVVIFFVLSGYLISGSVSRSLQQGRWSWRGYALHRLVRLWVVLVPGLLLCLFWDSIGIHLHHILYEGLIPNYEMGDIRKVLTLKGFFGNLFFLQTIVVPPYGSDGSLWSLAYEFWYYALFPLGLFCVRPASTMRQRIVSAILFIAIALLVGSNILILFPIWLLGAVLALVKPPRLGSWARWAAAIVYYPLISIFSRTRLTTDLAQDYLFALLTALLIWIMLSAKERAVPSMWFVRGSRDLSRFSYSMYLMHAPVILISISFLIGRRRWAPTACHIAVSVGLFLLTIGYSYVIASATEFKTDAVRRKIERTFQRA